MCLPGYSSVHHQTKPSLYIPTDSYAGEVLGSLDVEVVVFQMTCDGQAKMLNTTAVTESTGNSDLGTECRGCRVANDIVSTGM